MTTSERMISPVAESFQRRSAPPRPPSLAEARVGLVDCMLNPSGMWGQGILDGVEQALASRWAGIAFERVPRLQVGGEPSEIWAPAMARQFEALVFAAGD